jgi:O-antigen ligase
MSRRLFLGVLALYVVILPISGTTALRSIAFALLVVLTLRQVLLGRLRLDLPLRWPWAVYAAVALCSVFYAVDAAYTLSEIRVEIGYDLAIFVIAASWFRDRGSFGDMARMLVAANLVFIAGSAWSALTGPGIPQGAWHSGVGATATAIATELPWIAIMAVRAASERKQGTTLFLAALCVANLGALALTMNRQGWLSLIVSLAVAAILAGRAFWTPHRALAVATLSALLVMLFALQLHQRASDETAAPQTVDSDVRWPLWRFTMDRISERPWTGGGFGRESFKLQFPDYYRTHPQLWHAHNMVLNKGIQMGIPGMAAFLALWLTLAAACSKGLKVPGMRSWGIAALAMITGVFARNMVDDFFVRDLSLLFWLICGAFLGTLQSEAARCQHQE